MDIAKQARRIFRRTLVIGLTGYCIHGIVYKGWLHSGNTILSNPADSRMQRILQQVRSKERFVPTFWAHGSYAQIALLVLWQNWYRRHAKFKRHVLTCEDGGQVAVEEYDPDPLPGLDPLPLDAPILLVFHTITGCSTTETEFCSYAHSRGFRPIVLLRRGHFGSMQVSKDLENQSSSETFPLRFNLLGCVKDSKQMVDYVARLYPDAFIGACGISAGSGQLVSYIGLQAGPTPVRAAVSACPAYDISEAFIHFKSKSPLLDAYLLNSLKQFFLKQNAATLSTRKGYDECMKSKTVHEFQENACHLAGFDTVEEYFEFTNPMNRYTTNEIPCLVLNALDDPLCVEENIRRDIAEKSMHYSILLSTSGSHVAYREGLSGQGCYMHRVAVDFIEAVYQDWQARPVTADVVEQ